jgi:hypothetical protein
MSPWHIWPLAWRRTRAAGFYRPAARALSVASLLYESLARLFDCQKGLIAFIALAVGIAPDPVASEARPPRRALIWCFKLQILGSPAHFRHRKPWELTFFPFFQPSLFKRLHRLPRKFYCSPLRPNIAIARGDAWRRSPPRCSRSVKGSGHDKIHDSKDSDFPRALVSKKAGQPSSLFAGNQSRCLAG